MMQTNGMTFVSFDFHYLAQEIAIGSGALLSIIAVWKSPIGRKAGKVMRWLWRRNVGGPVSAWGRALVIEAVQPETQAIHIRIDGVESKISELSQLNTEQHKTNSQALEDLKREILDHVKKGNQS